MVDDGVFLTVGLDTAAAAGSDFLALVTDDDTFLTALSAGAFAGGEVLVAGVAVVFFFTGVVVAVLAAALVEVLVLGVGPLVLELELALGLDDEATDSNTKG